MLEFKWHSEYKQHQSSKRPMSDNNLETRKFSCARRIKFLLNWTEIHGSLEWRSNHAWDLHDVQESDTLDVQHKLKAWSSNQCFDLRLNKKQDEDLKHIYLYNHFDSRWYTESISYNFFWNFCQNNMVLYQGILKKNSNENIYLFTQKGF